jgi:hypothetical protein
METLVFCVSSMENWVIEEEEEEEETHVFV